MVALDTTKTAVERQDLARAFLRESGEIADLRCNPLLLALLCNIYRVENYIPTSRTEVYRNCATMLFEKWDNRRGIRVELPHRRDLEPAVKYVAHWIYSDDQLQSGITEIQLVNKTVEYCLPDRIDDPEEAREVAEAFVSFCKGRAWIFTDTGRTASGVSLYQFTHRTFLEYFTAGYLVRVSPTANDLWRRLRPHILRLEWDVVAQISLQMKDEQGEGAAADFLSLLAADVDRRKGTQLRNLLSFAIRALSIVAPGQRVTRMIIDKAIHNSVSTYVRKQEPWSFVVQAGHSLGDLAGIGDYSRATVVSAVIDRLTAIIKTPGIQRTRAAILGLELIQNATIPTNRIGSEWLRVEPAVVDALGENLHSVAAESIEVASILHARGTFRPTSSSRCMVLKRCSSQLG